MKSMKKYVFLLVFFTHLVVAGAQAVTHTWKGSTTSDNWSDFANWDCGSNPVTVPDGNSIVKIPVVATGHKYPLLTDSSHAKIVTIEAGAMLDLSIFDIKKADSYLCKIINKGILRLTGTANQKDWFENIILPLNNGNISLEADCTVVYYIGAVSDIFGGPYENLTLLRDVKATSLTVNKKTLTKNNLTITSEAQHYKGRVESEEDVTFTTNTNNGAIKFEAELIAKNTGTNAFKDIYIIKGVVETKATVQAKNINFASTTGKWTSTADVVVEENISADGVEWKANSGNISVKKDLTASKLEQANGKVIANGVGVQNIKAKKIKELEVLSSSTSTLVSITPHPQTIDKINNSGNLNVPANVNLTVAEIENKVGATLNSNTATLTLTNQLKNAGILNIASLKLSPTGDSINIVGKSTANDTNITRLAFETAGGKTLKIKNKISVSNELKLTGTGKTNLLNVEGNGAISVLPSLTGEGKFLSVKTNIPIENGTYTTKNSKPEGTLSEIQLGKPENWIFNQSLYTPLTWKGGTVPTPADWSKDENWIPRGLPVEETDVLIPSGKTYYPVLTTDVNAKTVTIQAGASVDLEAFQILTASSKKAKISNGGTLSLSGTNAQRAWFEAGNVEHKITLENGSIVAYHTGATDSIYVGPYKNLKLSRNVTAISLTVDGSTNIDTAISITSNSQQYKGKVTAEEDVTFATNANNGTIKFEAEVLAKNASTNAFKDISITKGVVETKATVQAKNINFASTTGKWTSTADVVVEENISADGVEWKANSGNISVKKDLTASKLEQASGKIIANGAGTQNIKAKKIKELEVLLSSNSTLVSIAPQTQSIDKINNSGTLNVPANVNLTVAEINNQTGAIFNSISEIKLTASITNTGTLTITTLSPNGNTVKIEGNANQSNTIINNLLFENASGKTLEIKNKISISQHLKLSGVDAAHVLTVKGPGEIHLPPSFNDNGRFLHVHTNIPLEGHTCTTEKSKAIGSNVDIQAGKPKNWIFDDPIMPLTWEGSTDTSWINRENWRPIGLPSEETETIIPKNKVNYPLITSTDDPKAKVITIEKDAKLDLSTFLINTTSSKTSKILSNGILRLEGTHAQKSWFEANNEANRISLQGDSIVEYYGTSADPIWGGAYENLTLLRNITASSLTVNKLTKIDAIISITSNSQQYKGRVEAENDVTFATNSDSSTINFLDEVVAKNTTTNTPTNLTFTKGAIRANEKISANKLDVAGRSFVAEKQIELVNNFEGKSEKIETKGVITGQHINIISSCNEWISYDMTITENIAQDGKVWKSNGIVQAKNINTGTACTKWTSTSDITILENIIALTTQWNATNGNISVFKDCNSPKLVQSQGALILNGNGEQNLTAKTLNKLEMRNNSTSDKMKLKMETVAEFILYTGNATLLDDIIITKEFANNGGIFDALTNKKLVKLEPTGTLKVKGKLNISGNPNPPVANTGTKFYKLHCKNAGGKTLHFINAIEILNDENLTQDDMTLVLEGGSASSKLNIIGDGQIWFNGTPPYPKPKKGGKFLHVASGVQIRGGYYRVMNSTHDSPTPRNWIFEEYAQIICTLAINGTDEVCVQFSRPVAKPVPDSLKIAIPSFPNMTSISVSSYPKGSNKTSSDKWFFQFGQNFTPEMLLKAGALIALGESSLDFIFEHPDSDLYPFKRGYVSDIGLNLVNPVLAKNTKQIQVFDGSKTLPFINTSLFVDVPQVLDGRPLKLYADSGTGFAGRYWVPNKNSIPWKPDFKDTQSENTGAAAFSIDVGKSTPDTKMFILPTSSPRLRINETVEFMFSYDGLPCARLRNTSDIFSFDLWRFDFIGTILQRAGVTVLNNVINVSKDQKVGIEITTKGAGTLTVQIMTLDGNIVKTFVNDYRAGGNYSFYWNGRNEAGRVVARGMYFVRVSGKGVDEIRKVLVTHD